MLPPLSLLLLPSLALPPPTTALITAAEAAVGKIPGFTGGGPSPPGDYLISTWCFCTNSTPTARYTEGNYRQFEYYHVHQNTTYVLSDTCVADRYSAKTCLAPRLHDGTTFLQDRQGKLCRTWIDDGFWHGHPRQEDKMCYSPWDDLAWREYGVPARDVLRFNDQKRRMDKWGKQGPVLKSLEEAEEVCDVYCDEHCDGMDVLRGHERSECHVVEYQSLDYMCVHCKMEDS